MKPGLKTIGAALVLALAAGPALAVGPVMDWDPAYFYFPGATFSNQPAGGTMRCVGTISAFGAPLDFLNASMPATEYTFVIDGLVSQGTTSQGPAGTTIYTTPYSGGTISVYADASPDAVFSPDPPNADVPSSFEDDPPAILTGVFTSLVVVTNDFTAFQVGNIEGNIDWSGGPLLEYFVSGNQVCPGLFTGGATWNTAPGIGISGYLFRHDGKIDLQCPTPSRKSTWGRLKGLYR